MTASSGNGIVSVLLSDSVRSMVVVLRVTVTCCEKLLPDRKRDCVDECCCDLVMISVCVHEVKKDIDFDCVRERLGVTEADFVTEEEKERLVRPGVKESSIVLEFFARDLDMVRFDMDLVLE